MTKKQRTPKSKPSHRNRGGFEEMAPPTAPTLASKKPIKALNESQERYIKAIKSHTLTFATGPAGTGKTFVCAALAADALTSNKCERIIITRPAIEAGRGIGFLPGELEEKFDPYFEPFRDVLVERLGSGFCEYLIKSEKIAAKPLGFMRGKTFKNAWVILDEAQNTTPIEMKLFLTRIGEGCTIIVNGDVSQKDILGKSGLEDALHKLNAVNDVAFIHFTRTDIVRSGLVQNIVEAYESDYPQNDADDGMREHIPGFLKDRR